MGMWALCVGVWPAWPLTRRLSQLKCLDVPFRWVKDRHWDGNRDAFLRINGGKWPKIPEIAAAWVFGRCPRGSTPAFSAAFKCVCAMSKWENERQGSYALLLIQRGAIGGPSTACFINLGGTGLGAGLLTRTCPCHLPAQRCSRRGGLAPFKQTPVTPTCWGAQWAGLPRRAATSPRPGNTYTPGRSPSSTELWAPLRHVPASVLVSSALSLGLLGQNLP